MYCPICNGKLTQEGKYLYCEKGDLLFSEHLTNRFNECFLHKTSVPTDFKFPFNSESQYFCPSDGVKMILEDGFTKCPICSLTLDEFIYHLIERHPHKK